MGHYSEKWWFSTGTEAANQRAVVFENDNNVLASIFADAGLTIPLPNPTTTDSTGLLEFYAADNTYWVFVGRIDSGNSELIRTGATPTGPVLSVNGQLPDILGNVTITSANVGAQPIGTIVAKGDIYAGTGAGATARLPVGTDEYLLIADSSQPTGLNWRNHNTFVESVNGFQGTVTLTALDVEAQPLTVIQAKGDLYVGTANDSTTNLPVGTDGYVLTADSGTVEGMSWQPGGSGGGIPESIIDAKGDLIAGSAPDTAVRIGVGADGFVLTADSGATQGVSWQPGGTAGAIPESIIDAKGDLIAGSAPDNPVRVGVGTNGQVLRADSVASAGVSWDTLDATDVGAIPTTIVDAKGDIVTATGNDAPVRLPVGANGQVLTADSSQTTGLLWTNPSGTGDVDGPASSTDTAITRFDGVTGKLIQNSNATLSDAGTVNLASQLGPYPDNDGDLYYDKNRKALTFANGTIANPFGQQTVMLVHNNSGSILGPGAAVYITGSVGTYPYPPTVAAAKADNATTARCVGLCAKTIADGDDGYVVIDGLVTGYPTVGYSEGDYLYVSQSVAGNLTNVRPSPPDYAVCVGVVAVSDIVHGAITVFRAEADIDTSTGDVVGPGSATDLAIARYDGVTGKLIQNSPVTVSDTGTVSLPGQGTPPAYADGQLYYDSNYHTMAFDNDDANVVLHVGTQTRLRVKNSSGSSLSFCTAVYVTGDSGVFPYPPTVDLAIANAEPQAHAVGITAETIADGDEGYVVIEGLFYGFPTVAFNEGDYLYVSHTVAGGINNFRPPAPNFATCIAQVNVVDIVHGTLSVMRTPATLGYGSANQVRGVNAAGTAEEYKTLQGTGGRLTVTQGVGTTTFDVDNTLMDTKVDKSTLSAKGSLISATGAATPANLPVGTNGQILRANSATSTGLEWATDTGTGDVVGPASATDNALVRFDTTTGKLVQNSNVTLSDTGVYNLPAAATPTAANGNLWYGSNTLNFQNQEFADVTQQIGRSTWIECRNLSAVTITKGQAVYASGNNGTIPTITRAQANAEATSRCIGIAVHDIENASTGYVCVSGIVLNVDTTAFGNGDTLYLSPSVAGGLTNVRPSAPNFIVRVGQTGMPASGAAGSIIVQPVPEYGDVLGPTSSTDNGVPRYDGTTGKLLQGSGYTISDLDVLTIPQAPGLPGLGPGQIYRLGEDINIQSQTYGMTIGRTSMMVGINNTGGTIPAGSAVYLSGSSGGTPLINLAQANNSPTGKAIGITQDAIAFSGTGYVRTYGQCLGVNTSSFTIGDILYVSATTPGGLTNVPPVAPNFVCPVGIVALQSAGGVVQVNPQIPVPGLSNGQVSLGLTTAYLGTQAALPPTDGIPMGTVGSAFYMAGGTVISRANTLTNLNNMYLVPIYLLNNFNVTGIAFEVTAAGGVGSTVRAGLYKASSATDTLPLGTLDFDAGTVSTTSTGVKLISFGFTLVTAGLHYIAIVPQGGTAPNLRTASAAFTPFVPGIAGTFPSGAGPNLPSAFLAGSAVAGALPASPGGGVVPTLISPICGITG